MTPVPDNSLGIAKAHEAAGRWRDARAAYEAMVGADPDHPIANWRLAELDLASGAPDAAVRRLEAALRAAAPPGVPPRELWFALGRAHMARLAPAAARSAFARMLDAAPGDRIALLSLGAACLAANDAATAESVLRKAIALHPDFAGAWANLAVALMVTNRHAEAFACAQRAVQLAPASAAALGVYAATAIESGRAAQAVPACRAALAGNPGNPFMAAALADVQKAIGARTEALAVLSPFLSTATPVPAVLVSYGALCVALGRSGDAIDALERALAADPRNPRAWSNLGLAFKRSEQPERAADALGRALSIDPTLTPALCELTTVLRDLCDWDRLPALAEQRRARLDGPSRDPRWSPFVALRDEVSAEQQLAIARDWSRHTLPAVEARGPWPIRTRGTRLRIGYLSADLREHATARLMAGHFERHDRARFETFAYSHGGNDDSALRKRVRAAFEHWHDIDAEDDEAAANRIRSDCIDVLVDLKGHTHDNRLAILSRRPAPVQVHYLGFPGTLGFDAVSHLVADAVTVPASDEGSYQEHIVRLPRCYQVNDDRRALLPATPRAELGLPADGIVLACFNQTYKLSREFFLLWLDAMRAAPGSVLWVFAPFAATRAHLRDEAGRAGLDPSRLVFAPMVAPDAHLARLRSADLALDVLPYGSHTTGSDALWAGVPMLTCRGSTFAGRVGASLLTAVELSELIADSPQDYGERLSLLLREPDRLAHYRRHLETRRSTLELFDTAAFTRDFERAMTQVAESG